MVGLEKGRSFMTGDWFVGVVVIVSDWVSEGSGGASQEVLRHCVAFVLSLLN